MLKAAVIGLGKIGQVYDYDCLDGAKVYTHAAAYHLHPAFELIGGVDPDEHCRKLFEKKFGKPAFRSIDELYKLLKPDVVSLCVPTPFHAEVFNQIMCHAPCAVLCEKPIANFYEEGRAMRALAAKQGCVLLVNYMRRFDAGVLELKARIERRDFGEIYKGTVEYSRGVLNNGSHFIDLLSFLLGAVSDVQVLRAGRDALVGDCEPDVRIRVGGADIYFLAGREEDFNIAEVRLTGTRGMIEYKKSGEEIVAHKVMVDPDLPSRTILDPSGEVIPSDMSRYQYFVVDALFKALSEGKGLNSNADTALETLAVVEKIRELRKGFKNEK